MNQPVGLLDICGGLCDDPSRIVGKPSVGFDGFDTKMTDCWMMSTMGSLLLQVTWPRDWCSALA